MVLISCNEGEIPYLEYTGSKGLTTRVEGVAQYFLYSPDLIPYTNYSYTNSLGKNPLTVRVLFSSLEPKTVVLPGFSGSYLVPHGWAIEHLSGRAYMRRMNRFYGQYPNFTGRTEAEVINSLYPGYNAFVSPLAEKYTLTKLGTVYRPSRDFLHSPGFYSNIDPNISTNRNPDGEPTYVQPTIKPVFGKWVLQLFGAEDQSLGTVSFSSEPTITTGCLTQGCPPDTCEVVCGDTVCCYGSDGIAIESFSL